MKKTFRKLSSMLFASVLVLAACFTGACGGGAGGGGAKNDPQTLNIEAAQLGYGLDWLDAISAGWSAKTGNKVNITRKIGATGNDSIVNEIESLASSNDMFIYRSADYARKVYEGQVKVGGQTYDCAFLDITDICTTALEGESGATISSKMIPLLNDIYCINDKYYGLPWIEGNVGIVRNVDLWEKLGLTDEDLPLTTDQLFETCDKIKEATAADIKFKNVAPFLYSAEDEYYTMFMESWFLQYEGEQGAKNFLAGKDPSGVVSPNLFTYQGQQEMFAVVEKLLKSTNGYQHIKSEGLDFTSMQGQFLKEQAVFCITGSWLEIEMGASYPNVRVDYIATPIVSALAKKLSFYNEAASDNDAKLRELVKYVDSTASGYENKPSFATENDVDTVRDARKFSYACQGGEHTLVGSSYSTKTDLIKSFIQYMYSDEGMNIYYKSTRGGTLPFELSANGSYDEIELSYFQKSVKAIDKNRIFSYCSSARMFSIGGVNIKFLNGVSEYIRALANGTITGSQIMQKNRTYMQENWSLISSKL